MSHFEFHIESISTSKTDLEIIARDFNLSVNQPKLFKKLSESGNTIEFILTEYSAFLNHIAYKAAEKSEIEITKIHFKIKGKINPELLLKNSFLKKSNTQKIIVEITPYSTVSTEKLELWTSKIKNNFLFHQKLYQLKPVSVLLQKQPKILLKAG